jgi:hypothetical protein
VSFVSAAPDATGVLNRACRALLCQPDGKLAGHRGVLVG